jgi:putative ABC transport system permease protein
VVYSVLSFLMVQRRRSFGLLRALGMTPGLLSRVLVVEVLLIAAFGALLGLVAGTVLSDQLLQLVAAPVAEVYGRLPAAATRPTLLLYGAIVLFALAAAVVVTVPVLRDALAIPPGRLSRGARRKPVSLPRLVTFGALLCGAGALWVAVDGSLVAALGGLFLLLAGVILVAPRLGFGLVKLLSRLAPRTLAGRALRLLESGRLRLSPALAALSLALALALGMAMMILDFRATVGDWVGELLQAELYVSVDGRPMEPTEAERLGALSGVRAWSFVRRARTVDQLALTAYRLPPEAWSGFAWRGEVAAQAYEDFVAGRAVLASEPLARRQQLKPGDLIELTTPDGTLELPLAGVFRDYSSEQGFLAVSDVLYRQRFDDPAIDSIGLYLSPGTDVERFRASLEQLEFPGRLQTITPAEVQLQTLAVFDRTFRISWALAGLVGLIALVALTSALLAQGLERAREHATLRALGLSPNGLTALITIQAAGLTLVALLLAMPLSVLIHYSLTLLIQPRAFGWSLPIGLPPWQPLWLVAPTALVLGALTGLYPGLRLRRRSIVQHLRAGR